MGGDVLQCPLGVEAPSDDHGGAQGVGERRADQSQTVEERRPHQHAVAAFERDGSEQSGGVQRTSSWPPDGTSAAAKRQTPFVVADDLLECRLDDEVANPLVLQYSRNLRRRVGGVQVNEVGVQLLGGIGGQDEEPSVSCQQPYGRVGPDAPFGPCASERVRCAIELREAQRACVVDQSRALRISRSSRHECAHRMGAPREPDGAASQHAVRRLHDWVAR
jgi:hypothetical protein